MKATLHLAKGAEHQTYWAAALKKGMEKHGMTVEYGEHNIPVRDSDLAIIWSWKQRRLINSIDYYNTNIMVMERGYFPDRDNWLSLTMNGFHGRGHYTPSPDNGEKFEKHWGHLVKPWKLKKNGYVLLASQVPSDPTIFGLDVEKWLKETAAELNRLGYKVRLRLHPWITRKVKLKILPPVVIEGTTLSEEEDLYKDLDGASFVLTYNSTIANDALLYGVPCLTMDIGSLAYPVTSHSLKEPIITPDRSNWFNQMAWRQWSIEELENGTAWEHSRQSLPEKFFK